MTTMKAAVMTVAGPPSVLAVHNDIPIPTPSEGQVLIKIHGAGLNRSELFTRQGHSPGLVFPRILGIEATGTIAAAPGNEAAFPIGTPCATAMGGLGRQIDGGYAEYTVVSTKNVRLLPADAVKALGWATVAAAPEMLQTAYGSLGPRAIGLKAGESILIRGGTTSVGLAAASLAKHMFKASRVLSTSRRSDPDTVAMLKRAGVDDVLIDDGHVSDQIVGKAGDSSGKTPLLSGGVNKVLELIGTTTLIDSLRCAANDDPSRPGIVCMTGIVGNSWTMAPGFAPMEHIGPGRYLTAYSGGPTEFMETPLGDMLQMIVKGELYVQLGKTFSLDEAAKAHETMEANKAGGKAVLLTKFGSEGMAT